LRLRWRLFFDCGFDWSHFKRREQKRIG
jgi:hypothetical protein